MTTKTLEKTVQNLSREVSTLRAFVIESVLNEDDEGTYRPSFIKKILKSTKHKPTLVYEGRGSLLRQLHEA
jgi:hypothetical protein